MPGQKVVAFIGTSGILELYIDDVKGGFDEPVIVEKDKINNVSSILETSSHFLPDYYEEIKADPFFASAMERINVHEILYHFTPTYPKKEDVNPPPKKQ